MDPTTTLVTFMFETDPSVQSVQLIGSWDNFSTCYTMERDARRGRGQWRGCYSFKNIVCDEAPRYDHKRNGGLKMGQTYYYYYELDGSIETFDSTMPSTTTCPYMPGQAVNALNVPFERTVRNRSASMNSMHQENLRTMKPESRFNSARPSPLSRSETPHQRSAATASILRHCASSRSLSPSPSWKRFFSRKTQTQVEKRGRSLERDESEDQLFTSYDNVVSCQTSGMMHSRTSTPTEGTRTRDISPDSLRRFLSDDTPSRPTLKASEAIEQSVSTISDDMGDETDDDDNFATSAVSEVHTYATGLSPPPFQRSSSSDSVPQLPPTSSTLTIKPAKYRNNPISAPTSALAPKAQPRWSISIASTAVTASTASSPEVDSIPEFEPVAEYDSHDEDELTLHNEEEHIRLAAPPRGILKREETFGGYSLPRPADGKKKAFTGSSNIIPEGSPEIQISTSNHLGTHIDSGLDDFVTQLGWIVDVISQTSDS